MSTTPLHKIPPLIRAISLMAGGGAVLSLIWHSTTKKTSSGPFWVVGGAMFFTGWCNYFYRVVLLHLFTFVIDANYIVNIKRSNIWWDDKKRTPGLPSKMILINHSQLILPENFKKKFPKKISKKKFHPKNFHPKIFTQKMFTRKNITHKNFTQNFHSKKFSPKKFHPKKNVHSKNVHPTNFHPKKFSHKKFFAQRIFFTESVRLSFVDLRWAQLYVSLAF